MLRIMDKTIYLEKSELLYEGKFTQEQLEKDFEITGGEWHVEDGWLTGYLEEDAGGLIYSWKHYPGDILMEFEGRTVPPYDNDLNFTFCANGWDAEKNDAKESYIAGLSGWWTGKTGVERAPEYKLQAMSGLHDLVPGKTYRIHAGRVGNWVFIFIDGKLAVEMQDTDPIAFGRVGFGVYACKAQFRNFKLYKPYSEEFKTTYKEIHQKSWK